MGYGKIWQSYHFDQYLCVFNIIVNILNAKTHVSYRYTSSINELFMIYRILCFMHLDYELTKES